MKYQKALGDPATKSGKSDLSEKSFTNCFGISVRLIGQSLVPLPPHNIMFVILYFPLNLSKLQALFEVHHTQLFL